MRLRFVILLAVLVVAGGAVAGCAKDEGKTQSQEDLVPGGKDLGLKEVERGLEICDRYVARVCRCDADKCRLAKALPQALRMQLQALNGDGQGDAGPISTRERNELQAQTRKAIAFCVKADGALDPKTCPRD